MIAAAAVVKAASPPSRTSPNVLIFTDQASGSPHGYVFDGW